MNNTTTINHSVSKIPQIINVIDPNWLYSAIAQSSAAIVGIIGAFFTTRVINQRLQVGSIEKEIKDKRHEIKFLEESIKHKKKYINKIDEEDDLKDAKEFLEKIEDSIDPENPLQIDEIIDLGNQNENENFHNLPRNSVEIVYEIFLNELKEKRKQRSISNLSSFAQIPLLSSGNRYELYNKYSDEVSKTELKIKFLEEQISNQKEEIKILKKSIPLISTLLLLFGFSLISVFIPLFMLTLSPKTMHDFRVIIVSLVFISWLAVIVFFVIEILNIRFWKKEK